METKDAKYSWVETHEELVHYLAKKQDDQKGLINLLKKVGITNFNDKEVDDKSIDLDEIDPFSFFCYMYKFGPGKKLEFLQKIAAELQLINKPTGEAGIPSAQAQKVWLIPI